MLRRTRRLLLLLLLSATRSISGLGLTSTRRRCCRATRRRGLGLGRLLLSSGTAI